MGCSSTPLIPDSNWEKTHYSEIPGVVAITTGWGKAHLCTGNLIRPNIVLTAGHCLGIPPEDLYIVYNCSNISHSSCIRVRVKDTAFHPKYRKDHVSAHDLGVLITEKPITAIGLTELYDGEINEKTTMMAVGFGRRFGKSGRLYSALVRVLRDYTYELVAGKDGWSDPNPGDSGGPVFTENMKIAGVLSRSIIHGDERSGYGIYTKPQSYTWVKEITYSYLFDCGPEDVIKHYKYGSSRCISQSSNTP